MNHQPLTAEQRRAVKRKIAEAEGILKLCHHPENQNEVRGHIVALTYLLEHGQPLKR